jgi:hypothetical protein
MGGYYNWVQVMGKNPWLWFLPLFLNTGNLCFDSKENP